MGGCVMSVMGMNRNHEKSLVNHPGIHKYRKEPGFNVCVSEAEGDLSGIYRCFHAKDMDQAAAKSEFYDTNLVQRMKETCEKCADRKAVGWRPLDHVEKCTINENGKDKKWEYLHFKPTEYLTFTQLWSRMVAFGRGLREIGIPAGSRVGIYEDTRVEWLISIYGMWTQGITGVTVYASLGDDALEYAINEAEIDYIICNGKLVKNLVKVAKTKLPKIIYLDDIPSGHDIGAATTFRFEDVMAKGEAASEKTLPIVIPQPDDVAVIMYTSGTTGDPKGVVMSHGNVSAATSCVGPRLTAFFADIPDEEVSYVAYLPLAHILEFTAENAMILRGAFVGFGNPRTLTNNSAKPHGDLAEFKPVFLAGVPRVFDTIKKVVESRIPGGIKGQIFRKAYDERLDCLKKGYETPYFNKEIFSTVRDTLGGRCQGILSGGAPMSAKAQEFMTVVSGATVVQGYGLTETCAITTTQVPWEMRFDEIGSILPGVEVRLKNVEDWKHTDPEPRGEILVRGPVVTKGYFKQEEKTAESFDADGWFHTGDVGMFTKEGNLRIVGRVKALAKNAFGEYVALDALESIYVLNELCMPNGVCVLVDGQKSYIAALVLTDEVKATKFAKANGISGEYPDFLKNPVFQAKAAESLAATAKLHGKKPFECVKYVRVLNDEWTPENEILTAAMKLKRRVVDIKYKDTIDELFKE